MCATPMQVERDVYLIHWCQHSEGYPGLPYSTEQVRLAQSSQAKVFIGAETMTTE
jgi:hypothetical protein